MDTSTVPAAKGALLDLFAADATLGSIDCDWGLPTPDRLKHEHIWFDKVEPADQESANIGANQRHEHYILPVKIYVTRGGYDTRAIGERAWALAAVIETIVRQNPKLGLTTPSHFKAEIASTGEESAPRDSGWETAVTVSVAVEAHLT